MTRSKTRVQSGSSERKKKRKNLKPSIVLTSNATNPKNSTKIAMKEVDYSMNSFSQSFGRDLSPNTKNRSKERQ